MKTRRERNRRGGRGRKIRQGSWTRVWRGFPRIISFNYWKMSGWITSYLLLLLLLILTDELRLVVERRCRGRANFSKFRFFFEDREKVGIFMFKKKGVALSIINETKKSMKSF